MYYRTAIIGAVVVFLACVMQASAQNVDTDAVASLIEQKKYAQAIYELEKLGERINVDWQAGYYLGIAYFRLKDYETAEKYFAKAFIADPEHDELVFNLGLTMLKLGKYVQAIENFRKAMETNLVLEPRARYYIGVCLLKQDNKKDAEENFYAIIENWPASKYADMSVKIIRSLNEENIKLLGKDEKFTDLKFSLGIEYNSDDNVPYNPQSDTSGNMQQDYFSGYSGSLLFFIGKSVLLNYNYASNIYDKLTTYNYQLHSGKIWVLLYQLPKSLSVSFESAGGYLIYDKEPYSYSYSEKLQVLFPANVLQARIGIKYSGDSYIDKNSSYLDSNSAEFEAEGRIFLNKKLDYVSLSCIFQDTSAKDYSGSEINYYYFTSSTAYSYKYTDYFYPYSYTSNKVQLFVSYDLLKRVNLFGGMLYSITRYKKPGYWYEKVTGDWFYSGLSWYCWDGSAWQQSSEPQPNKVLKARQDNALNCNIGTLISITENICITLKVTYLLNDSNIGDSLVDYTDKNYNKTIYSLGTRFTF